MKMPVRPAAQSRPKCSKPQQATVGFRDQNSEIDCGENSWDDWPVVGAEAGRREWCCRRKGAKQGRVACKAGNV